MGPFSSLLFDGSLTAPTSRLTAPSRLSRRLQSPRYLFVLLQAHHRPALSRYSRQQGCRPSQHPSHHQDRLRCPASRAPRQGRQGLTCACRSTGGRRSRYSGQGAGEGAKEGIRQGSRRRQAESAEEGVEEGGFGGRRRIKRSLRYRWRSSGCIASRRIGKEAGEPFRPSEGRRVKAGGGITTATASNSIPCSSILSLLVCCRNAPLSRIVVFSSREVPSPSCEAVSSALVISWLEENDDTDTDQFEHFYVLQSSTRQGPR